MDGTISKASQTTDTKIALLIIGQIPLNEKLSKTKISLNAFLSSELPTEWGYPLEKNLSNMVPALKNNGKDSYNTTCRAPKGKSPNQECME